MYHPSIHTQQHSFTYKKQHQIQTRYTTHRVTRNEQQKAKILDPSFSAWTLDPILAKLDGPNKNADFADERYCLVFWGRPPRHIRDMVADIQREIRDVAPGMSPLASKRKDLI
jgi:vesicle-fusing ATPase